MYDNELMHYGVPGMKWGRRKATQVSNGVRKFKKNYDRSLESTKSINMRKANAKSKSIINANPHSQKAAKHKIKMELRSKSRYGQTNGRIVGEAVLKHMGSNIIGGLAQSSAHALGMEKTAKMIGTMTLGYQAGNAGLAAYKITKNYR